MKKIVTTIPLMLGLLSSLFFGCEDTKNEITYRDVEAILEQMIMEDPLLGLDEMDDDGAVNEEFESGGLIRRTEFTADYCPGDSLRIMFGRRINSETIHFQHDFFGDTLSITTIIREIGGIFITRVYDSTWNLVDSFSKPFISQSSRKIKFVPNDIGNDLTLDWRMAGLTLISGGAGIKIGIDSLKIFRAETNEMLYEFHSDEVEDLFISRDEIPTFTFGDSLIYKLYVRNNGPVYDCGSGEHASFRFGRRHRRPSDHPDFHPFHARIPFADDGIHGHDDVPNDDEFSLIWHARPLTFRHGSKGFVDVIDNETLFSSDGEYSTAFWGFPYKTVIRD